MVSKEKKKKIIRKQHGLYGSPAYGSWNRIIQRTKNPNHPKYKYYGGRGITVCDEWLDFRNFYKDMGEKPKDLSIERIDNNKGYFKENCKWATHKEQSNNKRNNRILEFRGKKLNLTQWANLIGINHKTLGTRFYQGWPLQRILTSKVKGD